MTNNDITVTFQQMSILILHVQTEQAAQLLQRSHRLKLKSCRKSNRPYVSFY